MESRVKTKADAIHALATLRATAIPYVIDELWLRFLRARNILEGHETELDKLLYVRAEYMEVSHLVLLALETLTKLAEQGMTDDELLAVNERFTAAYYKREARQETLPW